MWFVLSLIALLCWSGSDMFSKIGSKPSDKLSHWKMVMAVGLVMGLHAAYEIFIGGVKISWDVIVAYLPASFMYILSMTLGYVGLRYIELSVSSPICNSSGGIALADRMISSPRNPHLSASVSSVAEEQSSPHPSSFRIFRMAGFGSALTAKYSRKSGFHPKAAFSARALSRIPASS